MLSLYGFHHPPERPAELAVEIFHVYLALLPINSRSKCTAFGPGLAVWQICWIRKMFGSSHGSRLPLWLEQRI